MIVDITKHMNHLKLGCYPTYLTWTVWNHCVLGRNEENAVRDLVQSYLAATMQGPIGPSLRFDFKDEDGRHKLKAIFGPGGHRVDGCVVIMLADEVPLLTPKFPLGQIILADRAREDLCPGYINVALGRHAVGDWEAERDNDDALASGGRLTSFYELPSIGEDGVWIITEADRSRTTVWSMWDRLP